MSYSVVITYTNKAGQTQTVGTNSTRVNTVTSDIQRQGGSVVSIVAQGAGKNVTQPVKEAVPSAVVGKTSTTIYQAGTEIGKELVQPIEQQSEKKSILQPISRTPSMDTMVKTATIKGQPRIVELGKDESYVGGKIISAPPQYPIPEIKQQQKQPSAIADINSRIMSTIKTRYEIFQNPKVQEIINKPASHTLSNILMPLNERIDIFFNTISGGESYATQQDIQQRIDNYQDYQTQLYQQNYERWKNRYESKDIVGITGGIIESPAGVIGTSYVLGAGLGGFAGTKIGQTVAVTIPRTTIISSKNLITLERALILPEIRVTPALALNTGIGTIFGAGMVKSGYESFKGGNIKNFLGISAFSLPIFTIPFKAGYKAGGGYVQRVGAMSTVTDPIQRIQQKAVYDMMKITERLHEPYIEPKPYDITQVKETPPLIELEKFMKSPISVMIRKPAIGGSTAMDIQMGEFYRKGGYPQRVLDIAIERQSQTIRPEMRSMQPQVAGVPGDIDILLGGKFATTKMADVWSKELGTHVHISKPGTEYWGGYSTKPFTKSEVLFSNTKDIPMGKAIKWKTTKGDIGHIGIEPKYETGEYVELFHGTSSKALPNVLKEGLNLGKESRGFKTINESYTPTIDSEGFIVRTEPFKEPYISATLDLDVAKAYGDKILSIKIPKKEFMDMWEPSGTSINEYGNVIDNPRSAFQDPFSMGTGEQNISFAKDIPAKYISEYNPSQTRIPISVKTLSVREQFLRYGHSVLPSNIMEKSYRAYKDVPGFYDTFDVLQFQKGGTKLNTAMDRFLNPSGYKSPRVTIGEKLIKGIGGITAISEYQIYRSSKLGYVPSYKTIPIISNPIYRAEGYKDNVKQLTYYESDYQPPTPYMPIRMDYNKYISIEPTPSYTSIKHTYIPSYNPPPYKPSIYPPNYKPQYNPSPYTPPYVPPSYTPTYNPPPYTPPYVPPSYTPTYNPPPYYPPYDTPTKNPPTKKILEDDITEIITKLFKGYNVLIKERYIFKGSKTRYPEYKQVNIKALTKESAMSLLATKLKETARASGKIKEIEVINKPSGQRFAFEWADVAKEFYEKQGVIIQKAAHRIGTSGEKMEITYKGLAARRM